MAMLTRCGWKRLGCLGMLRAEHGFIITERDMSHSSILPANPHNTSKVKLIVRGMLDVPLHGPSSPCSHAISIQYLYKSIP